MVEGGIATDGPVTLVPPSEAEVRWIQNGVHHIVKVRLEDVPKRPTYNWTLYVVINQAGKVQAKAIKDGDKAAHAKLRQGLRPEGEYRLGFINKTGHDLQDVFAYYGEEKVGGAKSLLVRAPVSYSDPLTNPAPSEVALRWKQDGVEHAVKTKFAGVMPNGYAQGTIFFVIQAGATVEVKPIKWSDSQGSINLVK